MSELESAVRVLAKHLGQHTQKSMLIVVDADGTFVFELLPRDLLAHSRRAQFELDLLLERRADIRAKTFGTKES